MLLGLAHLTAMLHMLQRSISWSADAAMYGARDNYDIQSHNGIAYVKAMLIR
jgi:hypothetical protein